MREGEILLPPLVSVSSANSVVRFCSLAPLSAPGRDARAAARSAGRRGAALERSGGAGVRSPYSPLVEMTHWVVPGSRASGWMVMTTAAELP